MANHTARAALAACLLVATVAAQAPASEDTRLRGYEPRDASAPPGIASPSIASPSIWEGQEPQGEDYSLHRLVQEHHGDFTNRR